jgi:X breakpoint 2-interacting protein
LYQEQKAAAAHRAQVERLQHERDEFQRMVISTQQVRIQQVHELKKKEKEFIKLQVSSFFLVHQTHSCYHDVS